METLEFKGYKVFDDHFIALNSISKAVTHKRNLLGKTWQKQEYYYYESERNRISTNIKFDTREELNNIRDFFLEVKGRKNLFWFPSYNLEIKPLKDYNAGSKTIYTKFSMYDANKILNRAVVLYFPEWDFITYLTDIETNVLVENGKLVNILHLFDPIPNNWTKKDCVVCNYLYLGRFNSDNLTISVDNFLHYKFMGKVSFSATELALSDYKRFVPEVLLEK